MLLLSLVAAALASQPALDLPVPSPCAQRSAASVTHYVYGEDRFLRTLIIDAGADGRADVVVHFTHDGTGRPRAAAHDDDADGRIDRTTACSRGHCTTNWIPQCPAGAVCSTNELGLVDTMRFGSATVTNDFRCWQPDAEGRWRYVAPADLPRLPER
jgi:hypothetical protein